MRNVPLADIDHLPNAVLPISTDYADGQLLDWHEHRRAQFLYGTTGTMIVDTDDGTWTVPTRRAVMIPARTRHRVRMLEVRTGSLYIEPSAVPWWPASCVVVDVNSLMHELLTAAADLDIENDHSGRGAALTALLLHELASFTALPLHVDVPRSADLAELCRTYLDAPDVSVSNDQWAQQLNTSERSLTRRFRDEVGMSPAAWRVRARLLAAVPLLRHHSVTQVAARLGYATPAAFSYAFGRAFGIAPSTIS
ncbi:AraC family transcriptional regulator [Mycobacteroides immunogenum]|uniref:AraC family transcriptional regulator n=1 Tax=Mycobacteroides immunogenum TaxID=83262 RepID=A0A179V796_9MYCO|nr:helix-turn-helix transcriptional regulator [Mycobacteroides immunogenum]OAT66913.1 AraC family transcriptional regulator [Mycobacteroides immunogenum]